MMGPTVTMKVYRDGSRALVDQSYPGGHNRTLYDLTSHQSITWNPENAQAPCSAGRWSGDWGDPFATAASMNADIQKQHPKELPGDTINGFTTKVYATAMPTGDAKAWVDVKTGLIAKLEMTPKGGKPQTFMELKDVSLSHPSADLFTLPAACRDVAAPPPPSAPAEGTVDAIMPPPSKTSCSPTFKVVRAGSNSPITSGFQVAVDTTVDLEHRANYKIGVGAGGRATFSGGGLHEVTAQMHDGAFRIDNAPPQWDMEVQFGGNAGSASALIYRQCFGAQPMLLMVVKNPAKLSDGVEWRWVKQ
jgi:hypothetical protein